MAIFEDAVAAATESEQALRALAHTTRHVDDPRQLYVILGSLSCATASLGQSLHQLASLHDRAPQHPRWTPRNSPADRAATYQASWELHRAGEILRQVADAISQAHELEGTITYEHRQAPALLEANRAHPPAGIEL